MNFSLYIAKRYLFSKSSNNTINIISIIAAIGVSIGTLALFLVLSGFSGLRVFSEKLLSTSDPAIKISATKGKTFLTNGAIFKALDASKHTANYTKVIEERAFLSFKQKNVIAYIKGVDSNYTKVIRMDTTLIEGNWFPKKASSFSVIGNGISNTLSLGILSIAEPLKIYVPKPGKGYIKNAQSAFNSIHTQVSGIYAITEDLDKKFAFVSLPLAQQLLGYQSQQISAIEVLVEDKQQVASEIKRLKKTLGSDYKIESREELNSAFYRMLNLENLFGYLIFALILIIALFNVIGAIIMMILDKKDDVKTLFNLGASITEIKRVFILQGFLFSFFGLLVGLFLGISLVIFQQHFSLLMLTETLAFPVALTLKNILIVIVTMVVLGYLSAKIASSRISEKLVR